VTRRTIGARGGRGPGRAHFIRTHLAARAAAVAAGLALLLAPAALSAHGVPTPLDYWGAFGRRVARCQRVIARNAAVCALRSWNIRSDCRLAQMHGIGCDSNAADAAIESVRTAAINSVGAACNEQQVATLVFLGTYEAESDAVTFCRELEAAAESVVFFPVTYGTTAPSPTAQRCIDATAQATTSLLHTGFESRQRLLDRIALESYSPADKHALLASSTAAIGEAADALAGLVTQSCTPTDFAATYAEDVHTLLAQIATRADCLAGQAYAQGGILCPTPVCGNRMQEHGEECDDGNQVDGDGCSAQCLRE
jgi:cysteine-rich repeat protein